MIDLLLRKREGQFPVKTLFTLSDYIDKEDLISLLDDFSESVGIYIDAVNTKGESFLRDREYDKCECCKLIQSTEEGREKCRKSYENTSNECFRWKDTYFSTCHAGIVLWSFPIVIDGNQIGAIVCGQVLLWKPDRYFYKQLKQFNDDISDIDLLKEKVDKLNVISAERCKSIASLLHIFVNYLTKSNSGYASRQREINKWRT